jgi:hypothetical protein
MCLLTWNKCVTQTKAQIKYNLHDRRQRRSVIDPKMITFTKLKNAGELKYYS